MAKFKVKRPTAPSKKTEKNTPPVAPVCFIQIQRADTTVKHMWYDMLSEGRRVEFDSLDLARDAMFRLAGTGASLKYRLVRLHEEA